MPTSWRGFATSIPTAPRRSTTYGVLNLNHRDSHEHLALPY